MEAFDVLIVGGGPSGSTCAWRLHQAGLRTLVLDRKNFPRDKPCAGWITPEVVQRLQLDTQQYSQEHTWQPITGFRCSLMGGREIEIDYHEPISYGIRRFEFDRYLLDRSLTETRLNQAVERIERSGSNWVVNGQYCAPMLVGAGGTHCPVARWLGTSRRVHRSAVVAQEVEFRVPEGSFGNVRGEVPALYFCRDLLGYGWCFRKGDYLNIGLGRTDATDFARHVADFQDFMAEQQIPCSNVGVPWKGHSYQLYLQVPRTLFADGVLLLGDSAGLAYAQSGEGIRPSIESALIAAEVIVAADRKYQSHRLVSYQLSLEKQLGKPQRPSMLNRLPASWLASLASWMITNPWTSRHVVMDRWFLHRSKITKDNLSKL